MAIINTCCWEVGSKDCCRTLGERDRYKIRMKKKLQRRKYKNLIGFKLFPTFMSKDHSKKILKIQLNLSDFRLALQKLSVRVLQTREQLETYMFVNFRVRGISRDSRKLTRTSTLIIIKKIFQRVPFFQIKKKNYKNKDNISQSFGNQIHPNNLIEQISQNYDENFILFILFLTCLYLLSE